MKKQANRRAYHRKYNAEHKRITISMPIAEYRRHLKRANDNGRKPGRQILAESDAYRKGEYLPQQDIEDTLKEISLLLRNQANNLNQLTRHSHTLRRLVCDENSILLSLEQQEMAIQNLIAHAWQRPRSPEV